MSLTRLSAFRRLSAVRLTLSLLLVFAVVTLVAWAATYLLVQREMNRLVDARLQTLMALTLAARDTDGPLPQPGFGQRISVANAAGQHGTLPFSPQEATDGIHRFDPSERDLPEFRYLVAHSDGDQIIVAEATERQEELRGILGGGMLASLVVTLFTGLLAGLWLAWRSQRRLDTISASLAKVAQGRLDTRITLPGRPDDLSLLADRINTTTARLDQVVAQMRVQSSNIAHDLRTPLARLRAQIESDLLALSEQGRAVSVDDLGAALEQIDRITGTFNALLRLARIESGAGKSAFATFDLARLADHVTETFGPVIEDAGQSLHVEVNAPARINGDYDLVVQLTANLIQNALRYGPAGQTIAMTVDGSTLSISDAGPGIPLAQRTQVLQPLFQLENTRQDDGFGLGLSMVRAICDLHGADLALSDAASGGGLTVRVRFPALAAN